ncbi:MAG: 16S rRNA (cytidine(1402)-2'-O)-methyltransferase [Patescibacteria group bacterium]|nr:16S rRNA (cytidine(1402)-2'-O)-methyltransferase [Patescibacteria group bacterium]
MGILYIVSTPIGNLQDITLRAMEVLQKVDFIASEDTRITGMLLKFIRDTHPVSASEELPRKPDFISYYEQNEFKRIPGIINSLRNGCNVALVTDAGTPSVSDPGYRLVRACIDEGIKVEVIPGPSSVVSALVVSGLPTDKFLFLGYLPRKEGHRKKFLEKVGESSNLVKSTVIFFEAPHRLLKTLEELQTVFGDIYIVICRELTKVHEEIRREKISESLSHFTTVNPKGEFVILFNLGEQK